MLDAGHYRACLKLLFLLNVNMVIFVLPISYFFIIVSNNVIILLLTKDIFKKVLLGKVLILCQPTATAVDFLNFDTSNFQWSRLAEDSKEHTHTHTE